MSADKNHEYYLEQIETAVAETTMDILEKRGGDLRAMAKLVAEKQVEINRLKEYQSEDRKTIRKLRKLLKECNSEREANAYDVRQLENTREAVRNALSVEPDPTDETLVKAIDKLKEEIELQKDYIDALPENLKEKEYYLEQAYLDLHATESGCEKLRGELEVALVFRENAEEEIDNLKEENERLTKFKEASISQVNSHLEQILELKEENKKLARGLADQTLKVCQLKINEELM